MKQALIEAERECTERWDVNPDKVLRPIGFTYRTWDECTGSTDSPRWVWWRVRGYLEEFKGRSGDVLFYERHEDIEGIDDRQVH